MISVVIPTYNRKDKLVLLLDALDKQVFPRDQFEVIVVDDASTDGTREFLESYSPLFQITRIHHERNLGSAVSRNDGVKASNKQIILFLDDDLVPEQGILRYHAENHRERKDAIIGNITYRETFSTRWISRYLSTRGVKKIPKGERIPFKCFWSSNASVRKEQILHVGLFDEEFKVAGGEDTELAYRLEQAGVGFDYEEKAVCYHQPVSLKELMARQRSFGENALPVLLRRGEVFKDIFKIGYAKKPTMRIGLSAPVYFSVYGISNIMKFVWLHPAIIDYLIYCNRMRTNS